MRLHKKMIAIQRKARKVGNDLINLVLILVVKHYTTLEYTMEGEEWPIGHLQCPKKTRKRMFRITSIPLMGVNLIAPLSQQKFPPMEEKPMHERATFSDESGVRGGYLLD